MYTLNLTKMSRIESNHSSTDLPEPKVHTTEHDLDLSRGKVVKIKYCDETNRTSCTKFGNDGLAEYIKFNLTHKSNQRLVDLLALFVFECVNESKTVQGFDGLFLGNCFTKCLAYLVPSRLER